MAYIVLLSSSLSVLALAQEPSPLEITVLPQAEFAVAGQPFTYTIVLTNVSQSPVHDVIVYTETPTKTTLIEIQQPVNWLTGGARPGETGAIVWNTLDPVAPTQVVTFELAVNVLPEMANQQLVSKEYVIITKAGGEILATSPPINTQVLAVAPTPPPAPSSTATPTRTATPTATLTYTPSPSPSPTPSTQPESTVANTATPFPTSPSSKALSPPSSPSATTTTSFSTAVIIITLLVLGIGIIGLVWFFKRR